MTRAEPSSTQMLSRPDSSVGIGIGTWRPICAALSLAFLWMFPAAAQAPDAARVLADMREAIGGQALASLQGFSVKGTESRNLGEVTARRDAAAHPPAMINPPIEPQRFIIVPRDR